MNTMILTTYNNNRGTAASRQKRYEEMKAFSQKKALKTVVVFPNGEEQTFESAMKADRFLGLTAGNVSRWAKKGGPKTGKFKGYTARYEEN